MLDTRVILNGTLQASLLKTHMTPQQHITMDVAEPIRTETVRILTLIYLKCSHKMSFSLMPNDLYKQGEYQPD